MNTIFFEKNCMESISCEDLTKISRLFAEFSIVFKLEKINMTSCVIGKNNDYNNIYIYSEDLTLSAYVDNETNIIFWVVMDEDTGKESLFSSYLLAKDFENNKKLNKKI